MDPAGKQRRRLIAISLALLASAGLVVAAFGNRWLTTEDDRAGMGLRVVESCRDSVCETLSNEQVIEAIEKEIRETKERNKLRPPNQQMALPRAPWHGWPVVGMATFIAALVAAAGLLAAAVLAIFRKRLVLTVMPTTLGVLGLLISIICGCVFVATKPAETTAMAVGWTFMTFGGAIVLGLASVFPLNRQIRPIDEELGEGASTMSWGASRDDEP